MRHLDRSLPLVGAALAFTLLLLLPAPGARAEDAPGAGPGGGGPGGGPCHSDVQRHCADARGTPGAVRSCLMEHSQELDPACRDWMATHKRRMGAKPGGMGAKPGGMGGACMQDRQRLCADAPADRAARMQCLRSRMAELSPACRAALEEPEAESRD